MATTPRTAGHRGRKPVKPEGERFAIAYVHDYTPDGQLPPPVYPVDVSSGITDWGMLGNGPDPACTTHPSGVGNCTFAGRQHYRMAKAAAGGVTEKWETPNELVAEYLKYDHGQDEGAVIADLLLAWYKAGKILAFAPVDHTDPAQVDAAMQAFHGVYAGVDLTDDADDLFGEGLPWTTEDGQRPDPEDGHCIVKVGSRDATREAAGGNDVWVTWGAEQRSTRAWTAACLREAWVIITSEDAEAAKLDVVALKADINALHGTGGSAAPAPQPAPSPSHPAVSVLTRLVDDVKRGLAIAAADEEAAHARIRAAVAQAEDWIVNVLMNGPAGT